MSLEKKRGPGRLGRANYSSYLAADSRLLPGVKCRYVVFTKRKGETPSGQYEVEAVIQKLLGEKSALVQYVCPVTSASVTKKTLLNSLSYLSTEGLT